MACSSPFQDTGQSDQDAGPAAHPLYLSIIVVDCWCVGIREEGIECLLFALKHTPFRPLLLDFLPKFDIKWCAHKAKMRSGSAANAQKHWYCRYANSSGPNSGENRAGDCWGLAKWSKSCSSRYGKNVALGMFWWLMPRELASLLITKINTTYVFDAALSRGSLIFTWFWV